jgi:hypothetical protein
MLKRVQHDKKKYVIPNLFRNLEFENDNKLITFVLVRSHEKPELYTPHKELVSELITPNSQPLIHCGPS